MADVETINELKGEELLAALEERAAQIAGAINSASPAEAGDLADQANSLKAQVPQGSARSGSVMSRIEAVVQAARNAAGEEEDEAGMGTSRSGRGSRMTSKAFQMGVFQFMSQAEKNYFNSFQEGQQYKVAQLNEDGTITETGKTVDGAEVKSALSRVKYNTLSEEQQSQIPGPDGKAPNKRTPDEEIKELDNLKGDLDTLESRKAQELMESGAGIEERKRTKRNFDGARDQVDGLKGRVRRAKELQEGGKGKEAEASMEKAMIDVDRGRLRNTLQKNILDESVTGDQKQAKEAEISGAQQVGDTSMGLVPSVTPQSPSRPQDGAFIG